LESLKVVIFVFENITALDAVGPYEVLSKLPNATVKFVSTEQGQISCMGGLRLVADYSIEEVSEADILLIPGGPGINKLLENKRITDWIRTLHENTNYTASVCTGSLLLGAAGILTNLKATTHWNQIERLRDYGAEPVKSRYVIAGKIITSAGVSAGIDMSLKLAELVGSESAARLIQLAIEYDPSPPFNSGHPEKASKELLELFLRINRDRESREKK
jgi:transcriptional regulator GlxA family with amidase domain